jgi:L-idonate 5-dehydrogenase
LALRIGADRALDVATDAQALKPWEADKGSFDAVFECSGNARALAGAIAAAAPRARIVQVGIGSGDASVPLNAIVAKEIELCGTFRFNEEFDWAVALLGSGRIDVSPLLSAVLPVDEARAAFDLASDRTQAVKVQLAFG